VVEGCRRARHRLQVFSNLVLTDHVGNGVSLYYAGAGATITVGLAGTTTAA